MAQQASSAQREPSMEEILASIRRIIEDNETEKPEAGMQPSDSAIGPAANDPARSNVFGKTVIDEAPVLTPQAHLPGEIGKAETSDEVVIDIDAFSAAIEEEARLETKTRWDVAALRSLDEKVAAQPTSRTPASSTAPAYTAPASTSSDFAPETFAASAKSYAEPIAPADQPSDFRPSIISEHAGRQVAASFGELSEAFAASRRRSFDEIAEDMVRPMLQDWLDNNLPVLVERLVREEIERVARG